MNFSYNAGIEHADAAGMIARGPANEDLHSIVPPDGCIGHFNTRPLADNARLFLSILADQKNGRALVLGGGSGSECIDIREAAPSATVHALGFTPFNPWLRIRDTAIDIRRSAEEVMGEETVFERNMQTVFGRHFEKDRQDLISMPNADYAEVQQTVQGADLRSSTGVHTATSLAEELQRKDLVKVFDVLGSPSTHRQFVGRFPDEMMPESDYDFIYENCGPFLHVERKNGTVQNDPMPRAFELLSERGMLYTDLYDPMNRIDYARRNLLRDGRAHPEDLFLRAGMSPSITVMKAGHPLRKRLEEIVRADEHEETDGGLRTKKTTLFQLLKKLAS